ncbi:MAG: hypothetical protein GTO45_28305 [Candidatus Aminicenantes bacterium]|nr:hypothetical protein [Candidatus Aminicenantes bacterium]NIN22076.1 hypothetical protein [Candidatus Aminicenantes bacterium]NIN45835.1 hypothetical protein [Candidatus Aminicenantes bacterium]NIN88672.1 hypothetical protein [Candidatus Aminicenantes bacterium]NIO85140.1 hypothetical protein [Candidatus Aminicenantes bacterium]
MKKKNFRKRSSYFVTAAKSKVYCTIFSAIFTALLRMGSNSHFDFLATKIHKEERQKSHQAKKSQAGNTPLLQCFLIILARYSLPEIKRF